MPPRRGREALLVLLIYFFIRQNFFSLSKGVVPQFARRLRAKADPQNVYEDVALRVGYRYDVLYQGFGPDRGGVERAKGRFRAKARVQVS